MNKYNNILQYERKFISQKSRFPILSKEKKELKKNFDNSVVLIAGAAGSIGSAFVKKFKDFNYKNMFLLDKDENLLTDLNRDLTILLKRKKLELINYICADLNLFNLENFIKEKKVSHYLNFAAIKHVRSEDNIYSLKYMLQTNAKNFLPKKKVKILSKYFPSQLIR